jgi:hypothetical protein
MEANEAHELIENHEQAGKDRSLRPVAFAMSVLAVLVAITTLLGHRASTAAVLAQARASDNWNEYQAKRIRQHEAMLTVDLLSALPLADQHAAAALQAKYRQDIAQWNADLETESNAARGFENEVRIAEARENRFEFGEALLEIGLVITSIALLTKRTFYALVGGLFGLGGVISAIAGLMVR